MPNQQPTVHSKLTERAVFEQTHAHMGHSTETALLKVHNDLLMNMDA